MRTSDLDFPLPEELIARHPPGQRRQARLMEIQCAAGQIHHHEFPAFADLLREEDLLVLNDTRVVPARLLGKKITGGQVEGLWLHANADGTADCMLNGGRLREGVDFFLGEDVGPLTLQKKLLKGHWRVAPPTGKTWQTLLNSAGLTPLPPYIRRRRREEGEAVESEEDASRYQSIWAKSDGAVAAPTASLHFDEEMLSQIKNQGVKIVSLTLHVGEGTFLPIETRDLASHPMHSEVYSISKETAESIGQTKTDGGRIVAIGTTVCRVLETEGVLRGDKLEGSTDLLITPGFKFQVVDALLTNFHTPSSTLLALVAAFAQHKNGKDGLKRVKEVYAAAVEKKYRFYSYGDASFWI